MIDENIKYFFNCFLTTSSHHIVQDYQKPLLFVILIYNVQSSDRYNIQGQLTSVFVHLKGGRDPKCYRGGHTIFGLNTRTVRVRGLAGY